MTIDRSRLAGWPIARLLPVLLVALVFLAMVPIIGLAYFAARSNYETSARQINEVMTDLVIRSLRSHLDPVKAQLSYISEAVAKGEIDFDDHAQWTAFAVGALAATPQAAGFVVLPANGEPVSFSRADRHPKLERRENVPMADQLLQRARTMQGPGWLRPTWSNVLGETILPLVVPIRVHGEFRGVVSAAIRASDLSRFLVDLQLPGAITPFILFDRDKVLAHPLLAQPEEISLQRTRGHAATLAEVGDPVMAAIWAPDQREIDWLENHTSFDAHWNWVGDASFAWIYRRVGDYAPADLIVGYYTPGRESAWARWIVRGILIAGVLLMVFTAIVAILLGRRLARPILALADAARAVERLDFERMPQLDGSRVRELSLANRAFERMARGLRLSATYLPRTLVARLTAQTGALPVSEDRVITTMFCDLEGYTAFSNGRPAVETARYLNDLLACIGPAIEVHGGTIDKYIGDGLMAFWGAPELRQDHARAACNGALAVAREVEVFNSQRRASGLATCRMRIGLHTGMALVGNVGFAGRVDYTAIGEAVNGASRLEQFGRTVTATNEVRIVVSASCREAALQGFDWMPIDGSPTDIVALDALPLSLLRGPVTSQ